MRDRAETEADLGTRLPREALCLSGKSFWVLSRRPPLGSRLRGVEFLVPVLLLRRRMRFRLTRSAAQRGGGRVWGCGEATLCRAGPWLSPENPAVVPTAHAPDNADCFTAPPVPTSESPTTNLGFSGLEDATQGLSSSEEKANLGMVSRLRVLGSAVGLRLRSCRELYGVELPDVQERRLRGKSRRTQDNPRWARHVALSHCSMPRARPTDRSEITQILQYHHKPVTPAQIPGPGTNLLVLTQTLSAGTNPWCWHKPWALARAHTSSAAPPGHAPGLGARWPAPVLVPRVPVPPLLFVIAVTPVRGGEAERGVDCQEF